MGRTLVIGSAIIDVCLTIGAFPKPGQDIVASSEIYNAGGGALNVGYVLQEYSVPFDLFAPVGNGRFGALIRERLEEEGFSIILEVDEGDNGHCYALLDEMGERTFITLPGVECEFRSHWFEKIAGSRYSNVYVGGYAMEGKSGEVILDYFEKNPEQTIYFGPGPRSSVIGKKNLERMMKLRPILHVNGEEAEILTGMRDSGTAAKVLFGQTGRPVFVTLGREGAICCNGELIYAPAEQAKVINTSGAGDAHVAALMTAFEQGRTVEEALKFANHIAAVVVGRTETKYRRYMEKIRSES